MARRILVGISSLIVASLALTGCGSSPKADGPLIRMGDQGVSSEAGKSASSDALWYPVDYSYVAGPGLALDGNPAHIYKLEPKGDPMKVAASVAKVFGVSGAVEKIEESLGVPMPMPATDGATVTTEPTKDMASETFVYYQVGSKDWTGPSIQLYWSNTGSWYYNNPAAYSQPQVGCASPSTGNANTTTPSPGLTPENKSGEDSPMVDCLYEPSTPTGLPSVEDARAQAMKIFAATGLTVSPSDIRIQADTWGVFANASFKVEGQSVGIEWSISWGDKGIISSAAGHAFSVVDMGSFSTISDRDAVERVGDWRWYGGAASSWYPDMFGSRVPMNDEVAGADGSMPGATESSDTTVPVPAESTNPEAPTVDVGVPSPDPSFTPKKVTVVLDKSARALLTIMDRSGATWLVPGYVFFDSDGGIYPVLSVVPGVIELPESGVMLR